MDASKEKQLLEIVRNNYEEIAASFDETRRKPLDAKTASLAAAVPDDSAVLDAACGNGRLYGAFSGRPLEYLGFDGSRELVSLAADNYPEARFLEADLDGIGSDRRIPDGHYDYIFFLAAWQHIPGKARRLRILKNLKAKVKTGGRIIISDWDVRSHPKLRRRLFKNQILWLIGRAPYGRRDLVFPWQGRTGKGSLRYYHAFSRREAAALAGKAGLEILENKKADHNLWLILKK